MKIKLLHIVTAVTLLSVPKIDFAQAPALGTAADFVLFTTNGAINISGITQLTGNVGSNVGSTTAFVNINGNIHDQDGASGQCASDLLLAYNQLNSTVPTFSIAPSLGNGDTLIPGVYYLPAATTLNLNLTLNAQGNANAVFIFQIQGSLSTGANAKVKLIKGALACNVYWKVEGLVSMASGTTMRGTVIANNAAINMTTGDTLEGRALSTAGAVTIDGTMAYTPVGCNSPNLTGPIAPVLASTECYALFSSDGPVQNSGPTYLTGDVGTNVGLTTGFNPLFVTGKIHPIADASTAACASDLLNMSTYLNGLTPDIELMFPAVFGKNLVLTPHTYVMNGAVTFTDTLYLNARGDANAIFVIKVYGAFSTSTYSKVILTNGTQAKNVFWEVNGAVSINDYSVFNGTIIANNGAINLNTGVTLNGRALSTTGALTITAVSAVQPNYIGMAGIISGIPNVCQGQTGVVYSVPAITNATGYTWVLPFGATIVSGANTNSITVNFGANALSGTITVQGSNYCNIDSTSASYSVTVCTSMDISSSNTTNSGVVIYPNPFGASATVTINNVSQTNPAELKMYTILGAEVLSTTLTKQTTVFETNTFSSGIYYYKVISNGVIIQSGKLISQQ